MPQFDDHVIIISDGEDANDNAPPTPTEPTHAQFGTTFDALNPGTDLLKEDLIDPCPDVHALFLEYNRKHFENRITHTYVEYSRRMTACAGTCTFMRTGCRIGLSEPLLKLRPVSDLKSTLLHEMIHAFLFLTQGYKRDGPDGHGPIFMRHAHRINRTEPGVEITPYHTFHAEVDAYRAHHWRCDKCGRLIKRAMNRAPAPTDAWWPAHARKCRGTFVKIAGPPPKKPKSKRAPKLGAVGLGTSHTGNFSDSVIRTLRIDHLMGRTSNMKDSGSERTACPMCDIQIDKKLLSKHLQSCIPPELLSTQDTGLNGTKDRTDRSTRVRSEPAVNNTDTTRTKKKRVVTEIIEVPESPRREPILPGRSCNASMGTNSKRRRNSRSLSLEEVFDVDALTAIAINPSGKTFADVDNAVATELMAAKEPNTRNTVADIRDILRPLVEPEKPIDMEQRAISKLKDYFHDHGDKKPFSFYEAAKMLKMEQTKLLESVRNSSTITKEGDLQLTREAQELLDPSRSQVNQLQEQLQMTQRGKSMSLAAQSEPGLRIHSKPEFQIDTRRCPLCEKPVVRTLFDEHVNKCLKKSNIPSVLMDRELDEEREAVHVQDCERGGHKGSKHVGLRSERAGIQVSPGAQAVVNCPICEVGVHRNGLESHVASCLKSTGLIDAL
ncbi:SprT-like protein [Gracilaria domingensis]|nr:SprT-like protein [Gracilaria domingensis]